MKRALITIPSIVIFAAMLTYFPDAYFTILILYFVVFLAISIFFGVRAYRRGVAAVNEISKGRPIIEIDEKEVNKLIEKDKELLSEFRKISRTSLIPLLTIPFFIILAAFLFPILPIVAETSLGQLLGEKLALFISYVALFGLFAIVFTLLFKPPVMPRIVRNFKIYETGVVIDKTLGLKAPIEVSEYRTNTERRFIEFKVNNQIFRVYYKDIKELNEILSKIIKPLKQ
ncbi:MAG: DUF2208 family protein [Pyrobaculum sp.]|jgi:uncharacterized membrane protein